MIITPSPKNRVRAALIDLLVVLGCLVILSLIIPTFFQDGTVIANQIGTGTAYILTIGITTYLLYQRGDSLRTIGIRSGSRSFWIRTLIRSILVFVVSTALFLLGGGIALNIGLGLEQADMSGFNYLHGNLGLLLLTLLAVYVTSSLGEEIIYRGFLISRLLVIFDGIKYLKLVAIVLSGLIFGMVHYSWGLAGIIQTTFMGWALAYFYLRFDKNLWVTIFAHMYMDTALIVQMY